MDEFEQACRGFHDKEFEPTEASEISRPSVSDGGDDYDVCGRNETETSKLFFQESSTSDLESQVHLL